jgi:hypothetical protein
MCVTKNAYLRLVSLILIVFVTLGAYGCGGVYGHEEFEKLVKNKSEDEVVKELGKPASVDNSNPARIVWTYNSVTYDIEKGNTRDAAAKLILKPSAGAGKLQVAEIEYAH